MSKQKSPREVLGAYQRIHGLSTAEISRSIGDPGGQLGKWLEGRPSLPLRLKVRISEVHGISIDKLCEPEEMDLARRLVTLLARDAAA
jgi:hypothetical protein